MSSTEPGLSSPFMLVAAAPGGFQRPREKETIALGGHNQQTGAEGGSFRVCAEMPKRFVQTLAKRARSPRLCWCLMVAPGRAAASALGGWLPVTVVLGAGVQARSGIEAAAVCHAGCAARVERPCPCLSRTPLRVASRRLCLCSLCR